MFLSAGSTARRTSNGKQVLVLINSQIPAIPVLERILEEEVHTADWPEGHPEQISRRYMNGVESGAAGL